MKSSAGAFLHRHWNYHILSSV